MSKVGQAFATSCFHAGLTPTEARDAVNNPDVRWQFNVDKCRESYSGNKAYFLASFRYEAERRAKAK